VTLGEIEIIGMVLFLIGTIGMISIISYILYIIYLSRKNQKLIEIKIESPSYRSCGRSADTQIYII